MSSAVVSTSAVTGRSFVFDEEIVPEVRSRSSVHHRELAGIQKSFPIARFGQSTISNRQSKIENSVVPASRLETRPMPMMVSSGISALDALTGGLPRGCLTEICGPASSGCTTVLLAALAAATRRGEFCAVVDASDTLDPHSAAAAGVELDRLLWVRCGEDSPWRRPSTPLRACPEPAEGAGFDTEKKFFSVNQSSEDRFGPRDTKHPSEQRLEQVLLATDLLLESGGFGLIALDLGDLPPQAARRIPLTTWFRFRRVIEHTPTILLAIEPQAIAGSCSSLLLQLGSGNPMLPADGSAAKRRKNAAHGPSAALRVNSSCGFAAGDVEAPKGRKKVGQTGQTVLDSPHPAHAHLLTGLDITAELIRSRIERKPARSVTFATKTAWAG
ncbi:RecA domain protein (modular protein) [Candidatus Sulfotelmatobacter kueseliae]|uniref:Protein RecA n=1 Tax=Candidatus Sulfotelmatobacter kueseliae TaxID=2042962 RepID=A0A2U3LEG4_9BACT|nr:RecA domain protein (modular protein) [Candidatus Sulfotelmatobacter kueseliae]